jgi:O-antigen/teichoic acid export membrane protein
MRLLDINQYADYSYIVSVVIWTAIIMDAGVSNVIFNKGLVNDTKNINTLLSTRLIISIILFIIISIFYFIKKPEIAISIVIYTAFIFFNSSSSILKMLARSQEHYFEDLKIILIEPILRLIFVLSLLLFFDKTSLNLSLFLLGYLISSILAYSINLKALSKLFNLKFYTKINFESVKSTFVLNKHYILYFSILIAIYRIDIIFMEKYTTKEDLSFFSSARSLLDVVQLFIFTIVTSYFKKIYNSQKNYFGLITLILLVIITITIFTSKILYPIIFPIEFMNSYNILNYIIISIIPYFYIQFFIAKLNFENKTKYLYILLLIPLIIKISIYQYLKESNIQFYYITYTFIEYLTFILFVSFFLIRKIHKPKNTLNQKF